MIIYDNVTPSTYVNSENIRYWSTNLKNLGEVWNVHLDKEREAWPDSVCVVSSDVTTKGSVRRDCSQ